MPKKNIVLVKLDRIAGNHFEIIHRDYECYAGKHDIENSEHENI